MHFAEHHFDLLDQFVRAGLKRLGGFADHALALAEEVQHALSCDSLNAAHTGCDRSFADNLKDTGLGGIVQMCAAAQLNREIAGLYHTDGLTILFTKQRHRALLFGLINRHFLGDNRITGENRIVDDGFHLLQFLGRQGSKMREIKTDMIGVGVRTSLLNMRAQHGAQRLLQQVGGCVRTCNGLTAG